MMSPMVISLRQVLAKCANRPRRMYSVEHEGSDLTLKKSSEAVCDAQRVITAVCDAQCEIAIVNVRTCDRHSSPLAQEAKSSRLLSGLRVLSCL